MEISKKSEQLNMNTSEAEIYLKTVFKHWNPDTMGEIEIRVFSQHAKQRQKFFTTVQDCIAHVFCFSRKWNFLQFELV